MKSGAKIPNERLMNGNKNGEGKKCQGSAALDVQKANASRLFLIYRKWRINISNLCYTNNQIEPQETHELLKTTYENRLINRYLRLHNYNWRFLLNTNMYVYVIYFIINYNNIRFYFIRNQKQKLIFIFKFI